MVAGSGSARAVTAGSCGPRRHGIVAGGGRWSGRDVAPAAGGGAGGGAVVEANNGAWP